MDDPITLGLAVSGPIIAIIGIYLTYQHYKEEIREKYQEGINQKFTEFEAAFRAVRKEIVDTKEALLAKISEQDVKMARMAVFTDALEDSLPDLLIKHANPIPVDSPIAKLLIKQKSGKINQGEMCELIHLLEEEIQKGEHSSSDEILLTLMLATMKSKVVPNVC